MNYERFTPQRNQCFASFTSKMARYKLVNTWKWVKCKEYLHICLRYTCGTNNRSSRFHIQDAVTILQGRAWWKSDILCYHVWKTAAFFSCSCCCCCRGCCCDWCCCRVCCCSWYCYCCFHLGSSICLIFLRILLFLFAWFDSNFIQMIKTTKWGMRNFKLVNSKWTL